MENIFEEEERQEQDLLNQIMECVEIEKERKEAKYELKQLAQDVVNRICHLKGKTWEEICEIGFSQVKLADEDFDDFCDFFQRAIMQSGWVERQEDDLIRGID